MKDQAKVHESGTADGHFHPGLATPARSLIRLVRERFGKEGEKPPLTERSADHCLGYGFFWLEGDTSEHFRWSRRFFGFYPDIEDIREIILLLDSPLRTKLTCIVDARQIAVMDLSQGRQSASFTLRRNRGASAARHIGFALDDTLHSPDDPRALGVRLLGLRVRTDREMLTYEAESFSYNGSKMEWRQCEDQYRVHGAGAGELERNANLNLQERTQEADRVASAPLKLYLEVTWLCNLRCPSCFQAYVPAAARKDAVHFMSPYVFREAAAKLFPRAAMVWYTGNGESLLHPNIETILKTAREFNFVPALLTNGTMFSEQNMKLLVEGGFSLTISVDSPCEKDFERLRAGAHFAKLVAALEHLRELQRRVRNERFNLRIQCVAQQSNLHQLADLVRWSAGYGAIEVQFLSIHNNGNFSDELERARLRYIPDYANAQMIEALRVGTKLGVRVRPFQLLSPSRSVADEFQAALQDNLTIAFPIDGQYSPALGSALHPANNEHRMCHLAWMECFVGADGRVAPCCINLEKTTVGNLYDDSFWAIWNGPKMVDWRQTVNRNPHGICAFGTCLFRGEAPPSVAGVSQMGDLLTVTGSGFSDRTVINFFNLQDGAAVNLGGLASDGFPRIRLKVKGPNEITFTKPGHAVAGSTYVEAVNPPYGRMVTSRGDPSGGFTLR
jgi:MoaA/NifB/PqqE/SkfB family radical SAM enzyme